MKTIDLLPAVRLRTPEGWEIEAQWSPTGDLLIFAIDNDGNRAGNPIFYVRKPNANGLVFARGEFPAEAGAGIVNLDANNRITNIGA